MTPLEKKKKHFGWNDRSILAGFPHLFLFSFSSRGSATRSGKTVRKTRQILRSNAIYRNSLQLRLSPWPECCNKRILFFVAK